MKLAKEVIQFFQNQGCVIVSTIDKNGLVHNACKGIVEISPKGEIYLLDLYRRETYKNLKENPHISITAVDEHRFRGYCLKGRAKMISEEAVDAGLLKAWEARLTSRITQRLLKNIHAEGSPKHHFEALMPKPEYLIHMEVRQIVDLTPQHLKDEA